MDEVMSVVVYKCMECNESSMTSFPLECTLTSVFSAHVSIRGLRSQENRDTMLCPFECKQDWKVVSHERI